MSDIKTLPIDQLRERAQALHNACALAYEMLLRYRTNIRKMYAVSESANEINAGETRRLYLSSTLHDAVKSASLEIDVQMPLLESEIVRGTGIEKQSETLH